MIHLVFGSRNTAGYSTFKPSTGFEFNTFLICVETVKSKTRIIIATERETLEKVVGI
jgi:hypothetical protein